MSGGLLLALAHPAIAPLPSLPTPPAGTDYQEACRYQRRHIQELEEENAALRHDNERLRHDNDESDDEAVHMVS